MYDVTLSFFSNYKKKNEWWNTWCIGSINKPKILRKGIIGTPLVSKNFYHNQIHVFFPSTGRECKATHHCVSKVWPNINHAEDTDSICKICTDMVQQARDQLQSNETQVCNSNDVSYISVYGLACSRESLT